MKTFKIPVVWTMMGYEEIEAKTLEDACTKVMKQDKSLPDGEYLGESFGIDREGIDESQDEKNNLDALPEEYWK